MGVSITIDSKYVELKNRLIGHKSISFKEQYKVVWRLYNGLICKIDYIAFKKLIYDNALASNKDESNLLMLANNYIDLLKDKIDINTFINKYYECKLEINYKGDIVSLLNKLVEELKEKGVDLIYILLVINKVLLGQDLYPATYSHKEVAYIKRGGYENIGEVIYKCLLESKLLSIEYVNNLYEINKDQVISEIERIYENYDCISKIYLFGSFSYGLELLESDIDLAILFKDEVLYDEKEKVINEVKENGVWFNGDWTDYVGRTLGGFVAGFGVGICTVLGAGVGAAALGGTTATLFTSTGLTLSLGSALGIGSGVAFSTGMAGYAVRTGISRSEDFKVQNMFIEGGFNAVSGALSVLGGYLGGMAGVHNTVFTKLLSQKGDFWLRLLVENVFTAGFKLTNALIKPYFMI